MFNRNVLQEINFIAEWNRGHTDNVHKATIAHMEPLKRTSLLNQVNGVYVYLGVIV